MKRKTAVLTVSYLLAAVAALGVLAGGYYERAESYRLQTEARCQHAFAELVTAIGEVDTALQKSRYAVSPSLEAAICAEIFGKVMTAQSFLGELPFSTQELEQTAGFISRAGDFAFELSRAASGGGITDEQRESLAALSDMAAVLSENLRGVQTDMMDGMLTMDELLAGQDAADGAESELPSTVSGGMRLIEQEFPELPSLIYDGPFSEHLQTSEPKQLAELDEVSQSDARDAAAVFTGINRARMAPAGETDGDIPCWRFKAETESGEVYVAVTKQGGKVMSVFSSCVHSGGDLSADKAAQTALRFLSSRGYSSMQETYHITQDNKILFNFAYEDGGVLFYPDLVKVAVATDTGEVCAFEAAGYLTCHCERELPEAACGEDEARALVSGDLQELSHALTVIPSDGQYELLCHEFKCAAEDDRHYIIYVNAVTGEQEKILILLEDESGSLTI
ncbi:MAG: germination protein YpeB [Oscillospiraceae bacterium]|nr:germination protein YpeB [Oscillospiraceae bacterium]